MVEPPPTRHGRATPVRARAGPECRGVLAIHEHRFGSQASYTGRSNTVLLVAHHADGDECIAEYHASVVPADGRDNGPAYDEPVMAIVSPCGQTDFARSDLVQKPGERGAFPRTAVHVGGGGPEGESI